MEAFLCGSHHCQTTISGKCEAYNELFRQSPTSQFCQAFVTNNEQIQQQFIEHEGNADEENDNEDVYENSTCPQFGKTFFWELNRKAFSSAIWFWIAILDVMEKGGIETMVWGPMMVNGNRVSFQESLNSFMRKTDKDRYKIQLPFYLPTSLPQKNKV